jgi:hypothetical protein
LLTLFSLFSICTNSHTNHGVGSAAVEQPPAFENNADSVDGDPYQHFRSWDGLTALLPRIRRGLSPARAAFYHL